MTPDELLAKLDKEIKLSSNSNAYGEYHADSFLTALRAVVELHKPDMRGNCDICSWIVGKPGYVIYEVCPTIRAIENTLL